MTPAPTAEPSALPLPPTPPHRSFLTAARLISFTVVCGLLFWGKVVAIPLALAVLLSFMLNPLIKRLQKWKISRAPATGIVVTLACAAVLSLTWLIGSQIYSLTNELPKKEPNITSKVREIRSFFKGGAIEKFNKTLDKVAEEAGKDTGDTKEDGTRAASAASPDDRAIPVYLTTPKNLVDIDGLSKYLPFLDPLMTAGLVLLLVIMLLLRWEDMRSRLISFSGHRNLSVATKACDDAGKRITRYLMMQLLVNGSYGAAVAVGFALMGVEYAALWALCAALFRYIPYVGPMVGALLPITFSFVWYEGWSQPLWVAGFIICLELVSNNVIEPWLYGSSLGLSAMGVVVSAVAWTFLWGPVGLVMATPLTVVLVVMGEYVPAFAIFTRLFGDKPVMEPHYQFYQRLLAHDEAESTDLVRDYLKEHDLRECVEQVFVPALAHAKRDQSNDLLEKDDGAYITATAERIFEQFREKDDEEKEKEKENQDKAPDEEIAPVPVPPLRHASVVIWPLNEFAVTAGHLLEWMLRDTAADVVVLAPQILLAEVAGEIRNREAVAVCLINLEGADTSRARSFVKRLRTDFPGLPISVARLGTPGTVDPETRDTFKDAGATTVTRTLNETSAALLPYAIDAARPLPEPGVTVAA
ncbi:MAG TPA: AI-2E family transporter [Verrucomicrobiales bacterium]|nr:AI-2E family transporter [Verrucomicrobiales bacterium]